MRKYPKTLNRTILFLLAVTTVYFYLEFRAGILREPITSWESASPADCAVVLTGGTGRVRAGFDLLSNHQIKKLIVSGAHSDVQMHELLPLWPVYGEINDEDVILEKRSETTFGNAQQSLVLVEALQCRDVFLITSRLHMPRAFQIFSDLFPTNIKIRRHAVLGGHFEPYEWEMTLEFMKYLLYKMVLRFI